MRNPIFTELPPNWAKKTQIITECPQLAETVKLQTASTTFGSPPLQLSLLQVPLVAQGPKVQKELRAARALHYDYHDNYKRRQDKETTTTGVATTSVCHRMCDNDHHHKEEEERLTIMTGEMMAQGEEPQRHYDKEDGHDYSHEGETTGEIRLQKEIL